jgi:hypothetical protein
MGRPVCQGCGFDRCCSVGECVRSWIVAGLIAGMTSAGRAQDASSAVLAAPPVAQPSQLKLGARGRNLESAAMPLSLPSMIPSARSSTEPQTTLWSENREAGIGAPWEANPAQSVSANPSASDWKVELPRVSDPNGDREDASRTAYMGSTDVPLDSWIYDALDRLAAMGYLPTSTAIIRPWTRLECARLLAEAHDSMRQTSSTA